MLHWRAPRKDVYPDLAVTLDQLLGNGSRFEWFVISTHRTIEEQQALWEAYMRGGPRASPPGKSAHNRYPSLAVDICLDLDGGRPGLQPSWDIRHPGWQALVRLIPKNHPFLRHGRLFGDWPHIEVKGWREIV
jgi:hypothetical protein